MKVLGVGGDTAGCGSLSTVESCGLMLMVIKQSLVNSSSIQLRNLFFTICMSENALSTVAVATGSVNANVMSGSTYGSLIRTFTLCLQPLLGEYGSLGGKLKL